MRAMVLAAGLARRLRPLSNNWPKCLMPLAGEPLLALTLKKLASLGVSQTVVNTHYLAEQVAGFINAWPGAPQVNISHEAELLGTGGALVKAKAMLGTNPFWHMNADVYCTASLDMLPAIMRQKKAIAVLGLVEDSRFNSVALDAAHNVLGVKGYVNLPPDAPLHTYSGLAFVHPRLLNYLPASGPGSLVDAWHLALRAGETIAGALLDGHWSDLGTWRDLWQANCELAATLPSKTLFGQNTSLHPSASLQGFCFAGDGVRIEADALVKNSVILPGARILAAARVEDAIIGKDFTAGGVLQNGAFA